MTYDNFTIKSQESILQAQRIAASIGQQQVDTPHLIRGILEIEENVAAFLLGKMDVNLASLKLRLNEAIKSYPKVEGTEKQFLSKEANQALARAKKMLPDFGDEYISIELILLGILAGKADPLAVVVDRLLAAAHPREIHAQGVQGHSAYPHLAKNPVVALAEAVAAIAAEPLDEGTDHFQPSTLAFVNFDTGNPAVNVIPGAATARFNIRFNDLHTPDSLKARIDAKLAPIAEATGVTLTSKLILRVSDVFVTEPGELVDTLSLAILDETGRKPELSTSGGTSDARYIKDYCEVVEFGLVGKTMHQVDERVSVEDIETLTRIYERFIGGYFAAFG